MPGASLHARQNSIKRTASDLSKELAEQDLPPPSALRSERAKHAAERMQQSVNEKIGKLELEEPEGE